MPRINQRASFTELLSVQSSKVIQHRTPLSRPQQNAQLLEEAAADMVGRQETGDWRQWYPYHKLYVRVLWVLSEHQSKTSPRASGHRSNLSQPLLFSHKHNSSQLLLLSSGKWGSPPSVRSQAHPTPLHSGVAEVSLGGCELSAQSPTEEGDPRLTGSLEQSLEHWGSREAWG